jgi:hypothetical protein
MSKWLALACVVALAAVPTVNADPDVFSINSFSTRSDASQTEDFTIDQYVWGTTNFIDSSPNDGVAGFFNIEVNSGDSMRPGFDYELTLDYIDYDIGFFINASGPGLHSIELTNLKPPGFGDPISNVVAKGLDGQPIGAIGTDGSSIFFSSTPQEILDRGEFVAIQFSQVPEPATMSLLALGGIALIRRRK